MDIIETPLCKLAFKYGTDKCPKIRHTYTPTYYQMFKDKQYTIKKILEIGIGYKVNNPSKQYPDYQVGGSLMMWRDFFPNAQIYGVDILPQVLIKGERIHTSLCDQYNKGQLDQLIKTIGNDFDVVIDDGSHKKDHQIFTCQTLMPLLKTDVLYIIEDVLFSDTVLKGLTNFDTQLIAFPNRVHDDKLIIVKNK